MSSLMFQDCCKLIQLFVWDSCLVMHLAVRVAKLADTLVYLQNSTAGINANYQSVCLDRRVERAEAEFI